MMPQVGRIVGNFMQFYAAAFAPDDFMFIGPTERTNFRSFFLD